MLVDTNTSHLPRYIFVGVNADAEYNGIHAEIKQIQPTDDIYSLLDTDDADIADLEDNHGDNYLTKDPVTNAAGGGKIISINKTTDGSQYLADNGAEHDTRKTVDISKQKKPGDIREHTGKYDDKTFSNIHEDINGQFGDVVKPFTDINKDAIGPFTDEITTSSNDMATHIPQTAQPPLTSEKFMWSEHNNSSENTTQSSESVAENIAAVFGGGTLLVGTSAGTYRLVKLVISISSRRLRR